MQLLSSRHRASRKNMQMPQGLNKAKDMTQSCYPKRIWGRGEAKIAFVTSCSLILFYIICICLVIRRDSLDQLWSACANHGSINHQKVKCLWPSHGFVAESLNPARLFVWMLPECELQSTPVPSWNEIQCFMPLSGVAAGSQKYKPLRPACVSLEDDTNTVIPRLSYFEIMAFCINFRRCFELLNSFWFF